MPIYTFATLAVVGDETERPQSGFCTYFFDVEQRISDVEMRETARQNILGIGQAAEARKSLISVLRGIHFPGERKAVLPLHPAAAAGLLRLGEPGQDRCRRRSEIMSRRGGRAVLLSLPAVLAHVTKVLHKEADLG